MEAFKNQKNSLIIAFALCLFCIFDSSGQKELILKKGPNGKFGYIDRNGKVAIDFIYTEAEDFEQGYGPVWKGDNSGIIDQNGKEIYDFNYYEITDSANQYDVVGHNGKSVLLQKSTSEPELILNRTIVEYNEKKGFYDCSTRKFILPQEYDKIELIEFDSHNINKIIPNILNYGAIRAEKEKKIAVYSLNGKLLVPFGKYDDISDSNYDGLTEVEKGNKIGFIDYVGKEVVSPQYSYAGTPENGFIKVQDPRTQLYGFINYRGATMLPCSYKYINSDEKNFLYGMCAIQNQEDDWGYINSNGKVLIKYQYKEVTPFLGNYAAVTKDGIHWILINKQNQKIELKSEFLHSRFYRAKEHNYLELSTFDTEKNEKIWLVIDENGEFDYKTGSLN